MKKPTKNGEELRQWQLIDCAGQTVGRLATRIADMLRGKHRPTYVPHLDTGDFVVAINAGQLKLTGRKHTDKMYWRHSGYMGGIKSTSAKALLERKPADVLLLAVKGMLPQNILSRKLLTKLKVYADHKHPHAAQFTKAATPNAGEQTV